MSQTGRLWAGVSARRFGVIAGPFIILLVVVGLFAPWLASYDPKQISDAVLTAPSPSYPLGTDALGRDELSNLLYGVRVSLVVGVASAAVATIFGVLVGAAAGYYGGVVDLFLMRVSEMFQVMPQFILAAVIVALTGPSLVTIILVIALLSWPQPARVMRAEVARLKDADYVNAARCIGLSDASLLMGEIVPNAVPPLVALGTLTIGAAILLEAGLSFLGLGDPSVSSWGKMLNEGQQYLFQAWWMSVFPGLAILVTVLAFNLFGDTVAEVLNPRIAS